ncbi:MAG: biotin--[acetyl-CoA-carboxylase] ligase [Lachnospiraceae bacterium]|nr:biotin--[acetyl-CoA-carboxylase] ligase [Lachnospiraceae bacterium]
MYNFDFLNKYSPVPVYILDEIDSTNEEAKRMIKNGTNKDFVILAKKQTNGKGRKGRSFYSPKDTGIYYTYVHFSEEELKNDLKVTVASSVIASKAIKEAFERECRIKWVNDLYFDNQKISGTLCECLLKGSFENDKNAIIVGIGINVSTSDFPEDISRKAGSICVENNPEAYDKTIILITKGLSDFFKNLSLREYMDYYKSNSLVLNKYVELSDANGVIDKGIVKDFDEDGSLILSNEKGEAKYDSGEISLYML